MSIKELVKKCLYRDKYSSDVYKAFLIRGGKDW